MDKDPLERLNVPIMTRVWNEIENESISMPTGHSEIPSKLLELKPALEQFIRN
jgi:hypothetical protein